MTNKEWEDAYIYLSIKDPETCTAQANTFEARKECVKASVNKTHKLKLDTAKKEWNDEDFWAKYVAGPAENGEDMEEGLAELNGFKLALKEYLNAFAKYSLFEGEDISNCIQKMLSASLEMKVKATGGETWNYSGLILISCTDLMKGAEASSFALCHEFGHTVDMSLRNDTEEGLPFLRKFRPGYTPKTAEPRELELFADMFAAHLMHACGLEKLTVLGAADALFGEEPSSARYPSGHDRLHQIRVAFQLQ